MTRSTQSIPPEIWASAKAAMDVWAAGDHAALHEVCACVEPLVLRVLVDETHDEILSKHLLTEALVRIEFGAFAHRQDVVAWAMDVAHRVAEAAAHRRYDPRTKRSQPRDR